MLSVEIERQQYQKKKLIDPLKISTLQCLNCTLTKVSFYLIFYSIQLNTSQKLSFSIEVRWTFFFRIKMQPWDDLRIYHRSWYNEHYRMFFEHKLQFRFFSQNNFLYLILSLWGDVEIEIGYWYRTTKTISSISYDNYAN